MRSILLDWLYDVSEEYNLQTSTHFLAIHILDSILRIHNIKKADFQLWGCVCVLIASKFEENQVSYKFKKNYNYSKSFRLFYEYIPLVS